MLTAKDGIMIVLSSPSGAGKTTLVKLLSENKNYHISISHTTRKPRDNEVSGKDYYFVNDRQFNDLISKNEFLEYANVFNHFYGTTKTPVIENLKKKKMLFLILTGKEPNKLKKKNLNIN